MAKKFKVTYKDPAVEADTRQRLVKRVNELTDEALRSSPRGNPAAAGRGRRSGVQSATNKEGSW